jgi:hypothetical protein
MCTSPNALLMIASDAAGWLSAAQYAPVMSLRFKRSAGSPTALKDAGDRLFTFARRRPSHRLRVTTYAFGAHGHDRTIGPALVPAM